MSDEEFFDRLRGELAERLGISKSDVKEMSTNELEDEMDVENWKVAVSEDRLGGLHVSDRYSYPSGADLEDREERVETYLNRF